MKTLSLFQKTLIVEYYWCPHLQIFRNSNWEGWQLLQICCCGTDCNSSSIWGVRKRCGMEGSAHEQRAGSVADGEARKRLAWYQAEVTQLPPVAVAVLVAWARSCVVRRAVKTAGVRGLCSWRAVFGDGGVTSMCKAAVPKAWPESPCLFLPKPPFLTAGLLELFARAPGGARCLKVHGDFPSFCQWWYLEEGVPVLCVVWQSFASACLRRQNWKMPALRGSTYRSLFVFDNPDLS